MSKKDKSSNQGFVGLIFFAGLSYYAFSENHPYWGWGLAVFTILLTLGTLQEYHQGNKPKTFAHYITLYFQQHKVGNIEDIAHFLEKYDCIPKDEKDFLLISNALNKLIDNGHIMLLNEPDDENFDISKLIWLSQFPEAKIQQKVIKL